MTSDSSVIESESLVERIKGAAMRTFRTLVALGRADAPQAAEMQDKFYPAVCDLIEVRIEAIPERHGSFYVADGILFVSEQSVSHLLYAVTDEYKKRFRQDETALRPDELPALLEKVFVDFLLHEVRHRTQGVEDFDVVQRLKAAAGRSAMAEIDVYADRDAAWAYASAEVGWDDRARFLEKFREALFLSGDYYFKEFPIISQRHDKIERAISVLLMAARLALVDFSRGFNERADLPLDAGLFVSLSAQRNALAIYRGEPSKRLLGVANDVDDVNLLVRDIASGQFDSALTRSVSLMRHLKLLE